VKHISVTRMNWSVNTF